MVRIQGRISIIALFANFQIYLRGGGGGGGGWRGRDFLTKPAEIQRDAFSGCANGPYPKCVIFQEEIPELFRGDADAPPPVQFTPNRRGR